MFEETQVENTVHETVQRFEDDGSDKENIIEVEVKIKLMKGKGSKVDIVNNTTSVTRQKLRSSTSSTTSTLSSSSSSSMAYSALQQQPQPQPQSKPQMQSNSSTSSQLSAPKKSNSSKQLNAHKFEWVVSVQPAVRLTWGVSNSANNHSRSHNQFLPKLEPQKYVILTPRTRPVPIAVDIDESNEKGKEAAEDEDEDEDEDIARALETEIGEEEGANEDNNYELPTLVAEGNDDQVELSSEEFVALYNSREQKSEFYSSLNTNSMLEDIIGKMDAILQSDTADVIVKLEDVKLLISNFSHQEILNNNFYVPSNEIEVLYKSIKDAQEKTSSLIQRVLEIPSNDNSGASVQTLLDFSERLKFLEEQLQKNNSEESSNTTLSREVETEVVEEDEEFECPICWTATPSNDARVLSGCSHRYCKGCLESHFSSKIREGNVNLYCPSPDCSNQPEIYELEYLLENDKDTWSKYLDFSTMANIRIDQNAKWCPKCANVIIAIPGANIICPACNTEFCFQCSKQHPGRNCTDEMFSITTEEDKKFINWIKTNRKEVHLCPRCKMSIEKDEGCNHITCRSCNFEFCWICGNEFTPMHYLSGACEGKQFRVGTFIDALPFPDSLKNAEKSASSSSSTSSRKKKSTKARKVARMFALGIAAPIVVPIAIYSAIKKKNQASQTQAQSQSTTTAAIAPIVEQPAPVNV